MAACNRCSPAQQSEVAQQLKCVLFLSTAILAVEQGAAVELTWSTHHLCFAKQTELATLDRALGHIMTDT
jgi:hypothetical protein